MSHKSELDLKTFRLLQLCARFQEGQLVNKAKAAIEFKVTERSIQRDIEDLRYYFDNQMPKRKLIYDRRAKGYRLTERKENTLSNSEILAVCKILLESRSMVQEEMYPILDKLLSCCVPEHNKNAVTELISNEKFHYIQPYHRHQVLGYLWDIGCAIKNHQVIEIQYERLKEPKLVTRIIEPVGIIFSEYYFYLTAFLRDIDRVAHFENADDLFPTIYRIDRIESMKRLDERFYIPYKDRFEEGEFRKRVQFMYGGKLERIKFRFTGASLEAVLDRIPTAKIIDEDAEGWTISAEVFGKGIYMWLRSQGSAVEII